MFDIDSVFASASWSPFYLFVGECVSTSHPLRLVCHNDASVKLHKNEGVHARLKLYPRVCFTSSFVLCAMPHGSVFEFCLTHLFTVWCKGCFVCFLLCLFMLFAAAAHFCDSKLSCGQVRPYESSSLRRHRFCIFVSAFLAPIHYVRDCNYSQNTSSTLSSFLPVSVLLTLSGVGLWPMLAEPSAADFSLPGLS